MHTLPVAPQTTQDDGILTLDEATRSALMALGPLNRPAKAPTAPVWNHILPLGDLHLRRLEKVNTFNCTHFCRPCEKAMRLH